ncbi:MAG: AAA family ATPase [Actinomycetota bacterium]
MEAISIALALQNGEIASRVIAAVENHPLLDCCGIARTLPDLMRLLDRFQPLALLISPSILEDVESSKPAGDDAFLLSSPLAFLLPGEGMQWFEEDIGRALLLPLRYCGVIPNDLSDGERLYSMIKHKVELYTKQVNSGKLGAGRAGGESRSHLITVTGAKGGVGTTLISCTLAAVFASTGSRVLLMDLDSELSQLQLLKPGEEGKTVRELLPMAEEVSWDLVGISVYRHPSGFYLLPYGGTAGDKYGFDGELPEVFLRNLLFLFDTIIIDFPRPFRKGFLSLLRRCPLVILVTLPDTLSAHCARRTASYMRRTGLDNDSLRLAVNRCGSHHALRPEELSKASGAEIIAVFPEDQRAGMDFSELGELPLPNSPFSRTAAGIASFMGLEISQPGRKTRSGWLGQLLDQGR